MPRCRLLLDKPETIPITIYDSGLMLQALIPRVAQVLQTADLDVYGSLVTCSVFLGGNT